MTASNQQIVTAFEELNMSPQEIVEQFQFDLVSVKSVLMQCSSMYRKACKLEPDDESELNFSSDELKMANSVIVNIAQYSDDASIQLKAACYIRNDKKGRLEVVKDMPKMNVSIIQFNADIQKALMSKERARSKVIEIPAEVQKILQES